MKNSLEETFVRQNLKADVDGDDDDNDVNNTMYCSQQCGFPLLNDDK